jgi:transcriptional regulator with XRE-family HTH domain
MEIGQLPDDFGRVLASLRQGTMKQAELARAVGVDGSTISRYESGDLVPSASDARALLKAIGTVESKKYADFIGQPWLHLPRPPYGHPQYASLRAAEQTLQRLTALRGAVGTDAARAQADLLEAALKREAAYLQPLSHDIAFIGRIAVGKTTALSTSTGLMLPPAPSQRRIKRTVLEVGGGNTTVCEVVAVHDPHRWGCVVVPQSEEEIAISVNDLCAGVLSTRGDHEGLDGEPRGVSKEIDKALRNMSGLPKRQIKGADGKRVTVDPMLDLADGRSAETLASEVFNRLKLWQRTRTELWYHASVAEEPADWLRATFAAVNKGLAPEVSLPKQITVFAPLPALAAVGYQIRVVDTRGIDEPLADRPDLRSYLEDSRTIPVLCSEFLSALDPSVVQLLRGAIETGTWTAVSQRSVVLLLPKNDEALQVQHDSGELPETYEEGYEIKADKVRGDLRKIASVGNEAFPVITYNSDVDDADVLTAALIQRIESMRGAHVARIQETVRAADALDEDVTKTSVALLYARVHEQLRMVDAHTLAGRTTAPFERLISAIPRLHPRTVWASVVRQGSWINLDVYHYLGTGLAADAQERCRVHVLEFEAALGRMLADDDFAPVHRYLKEALKSVGHWRDEFLQAALRLGRDAFRPALKGAIPLWNACAAEYGRGYGFRDRVAAHLRAWFEDPAQNGIIELLESGLAEQWSACFAMNVEKLIESLRPTVAQTH